MCLTSFLVQYKNTFKATHMYFNQSCILYLKNYGFPIKFWKPGSYVCLKNNNKVKVIVCVHPKFPIRHKKSQKRPHGLTVVKKLKFFHKRLESPQGWEDFSRIDIRFWVVKMFKVFVNLKSLVLKVFVYYLDVL